MDNQQDTGVSAAQTGPSQAEPEEVSALRASVPDAVEAALKVAWDWAFARMSGSRAEMIEWQAIRAALPAAIIEAIADAGYAITQVNQPFKARLSKREDGPYRMTIRAQMEVPAQIIQAEQRVDDMRWQDERFRLDYLPQILARTMSNVFEGGVARDLHRLLAQGIETGTAATECGPKGESPVATPCANTSQVTALSGDKT